jgi:hypothetical protein
LPQLAGETAASPAPPIVPAQPGANESTPAPVVPQTGGAVDGGVPTMPLPPVNAHLAPSVAEEDDPVPPKAALPAVASAVGDSLGAAPEGASQTTHADGQINGGANGATNGVEHGRRGSADSLFARRRTGTGVRLASFLSLPPRRRLLRPLFVPRVAVHS